MLLACRSSNPMVSMPSTASSRSATLIVKAMALQPLPEREDDDSPRTTNSKIGFCAVTAQAQDGG